MLVRVLLAVDSPSVQGRFRQLADRPDTVVEAVRGGESLWETVSRESFDLVIVSQDLLGTPAAETVSSLRTLPESPDGVRTNRLSADVPKSMTDWFLPPSHRTPMSTVI